MFETCPYCRETIEGRDAIRCPSCGTPHHQDCFAENSGCTVFGCESAPPDAPKIAVTSLDVPTAAPPPPLPVESRSSQVLYFVHRDGQQFGPYSLRELQQYVAEKRVAISDFAWSEGMPNWVFVSDVVGNLTHSVSGSPILTSAVSNSVAAEQKSVQVAPTSDLLPDRIRFGRGLYLLSVIGLLFVMGALSTSKDTEGLGMFVFIIGWFTVAVLRARDAGMNGWIVLLGAVPIANLILNFLLFCAPRGYQITKKPDTAMKMMGWSVVGLLALGLLIAIFSSASH